MSIKFVDELPPAEGPRGRSLEPVRAALRENPGAWAEIARFPLSRRSVASMRAVNLKARRGDIETATRKVGDEVVVYARAVTA